MAENIFCIWSPNFSSHALTNKGAIIETLIIHLRKWSTNLPCCFFRGVWANAERGNLYHCLMFVAYFPHNKEGDQHKSCLLQIIPRATL